MPALQPFADLSMLAAMNVTKDMKVDMLPGLYTDMLLQ